MTRLRDNQALLREVSDLVWGAKNPRIGVGAVTTAQDILDAVDRQLAALPPGSAGPKPSDWGAYVRWACDRPPAWPCRCGNAKAAHAHSLVASLPGKCGAAGCNCPRFEPEYEGNVPSAPPGSAVAGAPAGMPVGPKETACTRCGFPLSPCHAGASAPVAVLPEPPRARPCPHCGWTNDHVLGCPGWPATPPGNPSGAPAEATCTCVLGQHCQLHPRR